MSDTPHVEQGSDEQEITPQASPESSQATEGQISTGQASSDAAEAELADSLRSVESVEGGDTDEDASDQDDDGEDDSDDDGQHDSETGEAQPAARRGLRRDRTDLLEREGEVAADFLESLLDIADLDGDIDVDIDGDRASIAIVDSEDGRVPRRLVGPDGRVLEALQELTRMAVQAATGERSRLMLDVAGHRAQRRAAVLEATRSVIAQVKESGTAVPLAPMTAFERKVAHDEVLAAGLVSESEGTEPSRHVVVLPA